MTTLTDYLNDCESPVVFWVTATGQSEDVAIFEDTTLPFDTDDVKGEVRNGGFDCRSLCFSCWRGNTIVRITAREDWDVWVGQLIDYAAREFDNQASANA